MLGRWLVGIILLFVILLMMLPSRDEQSLARIGSASMLACSRDFREKVASQVLEKTPVTVMFSNTCPDLITSIDVDMYGNMVIKGNKHPVTMRLRPVVENGRIRWSCKGEPEDRITKLCKP
jgi:hypothetical protein